MSTWSSRFRSRKMSVLSITLYVSLISACVDIGAAPAEDTVAADATTPAPDVPGDGGGGSVPDTSDVDQTEDVAVEDVAVEDVAEDTTTDDDSSACAEECPAGNACTTFVLDPVRCICDLQPLPNYQSCDDDNVCTEEDYCMDGVCKGYEVDPAVECDDQDGCTMDLCASNVGCFHTPMPVESPCDSGDICITGYVCDAAGACVPGPEHKAECGTCDPDAEVSCEEENGDGDPCNGTLRCVGGICQTEPETVVQCDPTGSTCRANVCISDPAWYCAETGGSWQACGTACGPATCENTEPDPDAECPSPCEFMCGCPPEKPLWVDLVGCIAQTGCESLADTLPVLCHEQQVEDGKPCSDMSTCTVSDQCHAGECMGEPSIEDNCTCTVDTECDAIHNADGDLCNGQVVCMDGTCKFDPTTVVTCEYKDVGQCNFWGCNPTTGVCGTWWSDNGKTCDDDNNLCTLPGACNNGYCDGQAMVDCSGIGSSCQPASCDGLTGTCVTSLAADGTDCAIGNACLLAAECESGNCVTTESTVCDDGNDCTVDQCDAVLGCTHIEPDVVPDCTGPGICETAEPVCSGSVYVCDNNQVPGYSPIEFCGDDIDNNCEGGVDEEGCVVQGDNDCTVGTLQGVYGDDGTMRACGGGDALPWSADMCPAGWHICDHSALLAHVDSETETPFFDDYWIAARITHQADDTYSVEDTLGGECEELSGTCGQIYTVQAVSRALPYGGVVPHADLAWDCAGDSPESTCGVATMAGVMCCQACTSDAECQDDGDPCTTEYCDIQEGRCAELQFDLGTPCSDLGVCAQGVPQDCSGDAGLAHCDYTVVPSFEGPVEQGETSCDGLDNDCDGKTDADDEHFSSQQIPCALTQGVCENSIRPASLCVNGEWQPCGPSEYGETYQPNVEASCDGLDNDCDGATDESFAFGGQLVGQPCQGEGVCYSGHVECLTEGQATCSTLHGGSEANWPAETCNGVDDDCNGAVDDSPAPVGSPCLTDGVCGLIPPTCDDGLWSCAYVFLPEFEEFEETSCDGLDNDCDGQTDEPEHIVWVGEPEQLPNELVLGAVCGSESCVGNVICAQDGAGFQCSGGDTGAPELCDGQDNNCNEQIDEGIHLGGMRLGGPCTGVGGCAAQGGTVECHGVLKQAICSTMPQGSEDQSSFEVCNEADDDCDGEIDEGLFDEGVVLGEECDGEGECGSGNWECDPYGQVTCSTSLGGSQQNLENEEHCDGLDNDCDGEIDEGLLPSDSDCTLLGVCTLANVAILCTPEGWECDYSGVESYAAEEGEAHCDGKDNDCDGEVDEAYTDILNTDCDGDDADACEDGKKLCSATGVGWECVGDTNHVETCNESDDDCDGEVDEMDALGCQLFCRDSDNDNVADSTSQPSVGDCVCLCEADSEYVLPAPVDGIYDCDPTNPDVYPGAPEHCNGYDDDCDQLVDTKDAVDLVASNPQLCDPNDLGLCATVVKPASLCMDGEWVACTNVTYALALGSTWEPTGETICDGLDNDCDGQVDEAGSLAAPACGNQWGVCGTSVTPQDHCVGNTSSAWESCTADDYALHSSEFELNEVTCDYIDNDCDGAIDEGYALGGSPVGGVCVGEGVCGTGVVECTADGAAVVCSTDDEGTDEVCDAQDNDCDGETDEALPFSASTCGSVGVCSPQTVIATCSAAGIWSCDYSEVSNYEAGVETTCDELDNDCDGETDEGFVLEVDGELVGKGSQCPDSACEDSDDDEYGFAYVICHPEPTPGKELICSNALDEDPVEICDDVDNDCDSEIDEDLRYRGPDGGKDDKGEICNGFGECGKGTVECDLITYTITCSTNPNGSESQADDDICDGLDNDCDLSIDEGFSVHGKTLGKSCNAVGECDAGTIECDPEGGVTCSTWENGSASQAVPEQCNGLDDDCDGSIDEELSLLHAANEDPDACHFDGVCASPHCQVACVDSSWSCEYTSPAYQEGNELGACDDLDNDCDGLTDEDFPELGSNCDSDDADSCADGHWVCGATQDAVECKGEAEHVESCNGVDDDCDGEIDEAGAEGCVTFFYDGDRDEFGNDDQTLCQCLDQVTAPYDASFGGDCDDMNANANPMASEDCSDDDLNCDGLSHQLDALGCTAMWVDYDGDGFGTPPDYCLCLPETGLPGWTSETAPSMEDCSPWEHAIYPGADEICSDGIDNDCDDETDEAGATGCFDYLTDTDGDGYGVGSPTCLCAATDGSAPDGYTAWISDDTPTDCCDTDERAIPGQLDAFAGERVGCGGYDYDCDGLETATLLQIGSCGFGGNLSSCDSPPNLGWLETVALDGGSDPSIPGCGDESRPYVNDCTLNLAGGDNGLVSYSCLPSTEQKQQLCH